MDCKSPEYANLVNSLTGECWRIIDAHKELEITTMMFVTHSGDVVLACKDGFRPILEPLASTADAEQRATDFEALPLAALKFPRNKC